MECRVRLKVAAEAEPDSMFQFTHPYRVRHSLVKIGFDGSLVSIHAPMQGGTPETNA